MEEKCQDIEKQQCLGQILLAMTEVVFEVIPLGLQSIVILILDLPPTPSGRHNRLHILFSDEEVGNEGKLVGHISLLVEDGDLSPVDLEAVGTAVERNLIHKAIHNLAVRPSRPVLSARKRACLARAAVLWVS